ncbi:MAG TPA: cupin domain-containing protein [Candidatus Saccharimonadales bacterium]|nr:cupin domain-containing protein [Candidatus Saccharimonadales bacterium]
MKTNFSVLLAALVLVLSAFAQTQPAGSPVKRTPLGTVQLETAKTVDHVQLTRIDYTPGQATGRHLHPMPVVGYVLSGSFVVQVQGKEPHTYATGEVIYEPPGIPIEKFDNASASQPAVLIASYLAGSGEETLLKMLPPQ